MQLISPKYTFFFVVIASLGLENLLLKALRILVDCIRCTFYLLCIFACVVVQI